MSETASTSTQGESPAQHHGTDGWITPSVSYVEPQRLFCAFCGRPLARRYWRATPATEPLAFCDPAHADLYATYWLPLYSE